MNHVMLCVSKTIHKDKERSNAVCGRLCDCGFRRNVFNRGATKYIFFLLICGVCNYINIALISYSLTDKNKISYSLK